ncbi:MAG: FmdB family zinc ribbon protein [Syntrophales bacterium]
MPIYEFKCKKCSNSFEVLFLSGSDKPAVACPACKSKKAERLMSKFGGKIGNTS